MTKILGGWSEQLARPPFDRFDTMMYGMITNLEGLTAGTAASPGWSPERERKPEHNTSFRGKTLWVYGGGLCSPTGRPANLGEVDRIIDATLQNGWDGVDFDDECNMNTPLVIEAMSRLKAHGKETSYGFIAGWSYNHPNTENGSKLNEKVKKIIGSGLCDRLVHYCYAAAMWGESDIKNNVRQALDRTLSYGMDKSKTVLALTTRGLNDWNLNCFLDQIEELDIAGLFIWRYHEMENGHLETVLRRLGKTTAGDVTS